MAPRDSLGQKWQYTIVALTGGKYCCSIVDSNCCYANGTVSLEILFENPKRGGCTLYSDPILYVTMPCLGFSIIGALLTLLLSWFNVCFVLAIHHTTKYHYSPLGVLV